MKVSQTVLLLCVINLLICVALSKSKRKKSMQRGARNGRQQEGKTTVVSCRVFRRGVCKMTSNNVMVVNKKITNSPNCQKFCYATPGCASFTFFEQGKTETMKCVLFRDCNGELGDCKNCISGPIMPRINECLAARQEEAPSPVPGKPCSSGHCTGLCLGPRCPELLDRLSGLGLGSSGPQDTIEARTELKDEQGESGIDTENVEDKESDYNFDEYTDTVVDDDYSVDTDVYEDYDDASEYYDADGDAEEDEEVQPTEDTEATIDYDFEYTEDDNFEADIPLDLPLDEEALDEPEDEQEEVDVGVDEGFLNDSEGEPVDLPLPVAKTSGAVQSIGTGNTFVFFFCALGGANSEGAVNIVDLLNTGLGNAAQSLTIAPLPNQAMRGGKTTSAYTGDRITTCSQGFTILSPYGFIYKPGRCYDYSLTANSWEDTGASLTSFRRGATITKLGRYLMATGGYRQKRSLNTVEVFDPKKPKAGWKKLSKLRMPVSVSEHCAVTLSGRNGKEVIISGGKGRENRVIKLDVKTQKWYSLNRLNVGRRKHACVKASINGRSGLVVSGGSNRAGANITSVEFYDAKTGQWLSLPSLQSGRKGHAMTVTKGKLVVAGGEGKGRGSSRHFLDDMEVFTGNRWVKSKQKLDRPRSDFSLLKIPTKMAAKKLRNGESKAKRRLRPSKRPRNMSSGVPKTFKSRSPKSTDVRMGSKNSRG